MKVSLNSIKKYIDIPNEISNDKIAHDLTLKTVEVESIQNLKDKFHDIVVGKILEIKNHPNADLLKICKVDIGEENVQIVCGGINLYENELVVVSKPGAEVFWHGGEFVKIKETKMRGEDSYGMICGAEEVYLSEVFPPKDEKEIVDLSSINCKPGDNIADVLDLNDTVLEIDNKSLSNRPDLWGYYGIARELSVIYDTNLKKIEEVKIDNNLPHYDAQIQNKEKCFRYMAIEIDNILPKESPLWLKNALIKCDIRPINAIVDITNYVMITTGQPMHAFDKSHIKGNKIIVRDAKDNEELLLLDDNKVLLSNSDLVIADTNSALALAGIKGGKEDSILPNTTGVLLEIASFDASTIRKTDKKFITKTDSAMRYEKGIDTQRVDEAKNLALNLIKEIYPESKILSFTDNYPNPTKNIEIEISQQFLNERLGKKLDKEIIIKILTKLGYIVKINNDVYNVIVPTYRATGDVSIKDDIMGDIARLIGYNTFEAKPLLFNTSKAIIQNKVILERRIKEYLSLRCGFNEVINYPWVSEKFIDAAGFDKDNLVKLATPPAPDMAYLHGSLIPGLLEVVSKNLRYFDEFKVFEMNQIFEKGSYSPSSIDEILPIHKKYISGAIVKKDPKEAFYELKGVLEKISKYTHMENLTFANNDKMPWADINAHLDILCNNVKVGEFGLVSIKAMNKVKIKRTNIAIFEINFDLLKPFTSRENKFEKLPELPLVTKDLALIMDENVLWSDIESIISKRVKECLFIEEYKGTQIPKGKKSIILRIKMESNESSMTSDEINKKIESIVKALEKNCGAKLRDE